MLVCIRLYVCVWGGGGGGGGAGGGRGGGGGGAGSGECVRVSRVCVCVCVYVNDCERMYACASACIYCLLWFTALAGSY